MHIDLWSDFACPWCALGVHRLHAALEQFADADEVAVVHRSFELDPQAPARRSQTMTEMLERKYGMSPEQVRLGHERLASLGREVGMDFEFDRIQLGNTFDAHRLAQAARGTSAEDSLVEGLFGAYFTEGQLLSDHDVLIGVARAAGMDPDLAHKVLESGAYADEVRRDEAEAHERGISGVPHFVINDMLAVPGAQDVETLLRALERAWERTEGSRPAGATAT